MQNKSRNTWHRVFQSILLLCLWPVPARTESIELAFPTNASQRGVSYGWAIEAFSDLNGDGIGELGVAAIETVVGVPNVGAIYILSGSDFSVLHRLTPSMPTFFTFGFDMAELPDITGDKIPEILVSEVWESTVYIYNGATGELVRTLTRPTGPAYAFGAALAGLGTTDTNGYSTVVVSQPGCCPPGPENSGTGAVLHVFNPLTGELLFTIEKPDERRWFGISLANLGDINGDGRDDLAVGGGPPDTTLNRGAAFIVSGENGEMLYDLTVPGPANLDHAWAVAAVPDVDQDGKKDVLVGIGGGARKGAPIQSGHAYLFSGANGKLLRAITSPAPTVNGGFGWSVAGVPDITVVGKGVSPGDPDVFQMILTIA